MYAAGVREQTRKPSQILHRPLPPKFYNHFLPAATTLFLNTGLVISIPCL